MTVFQEFTSHIHLSCDILRHSKSILSKRVMQNLSYTLVVRRTTTTSSRKDKLTTS